MGMENTKKYANTSSKPTISTPNCIYITNLDNRCDEKIIWELFSQISHVISVFLKRDRISGNHNGSGFVEFSNESDPDYVYNVMNMVCLFGMPIRISVITSPTSNEVEHRAVIDVSGLDDQIDPTVLLELFSPFGKILQTPKIYRSNSKSGTVSTKIFLDSFSNADKCIDALDGHIIMNKKIKLTYEKKANRSSTL